MTGRTWLWLIPALLYAVFLIWYTDFGGKLSPAEIDEFVATLESQDVPDQMRDRLRTFMEDDTGRQFLMVNNIDMAENPPNVEGAEPGLSADQLMDHYMEHMYAELFKRACHPVVYGTAAFRAMDIVGIEGAENWDIGALFRYRSRRTFMQIIQIPETRERHEYKVAALDKTIAFPIETQLYLGDPRVLLGLILLSATALLDRVLY